MNNFKSPIYNVTAVPYEQVQANTYNPNAQDKIAFTLLEESVWQDGYTQPVVCYLLENGKYEVVDGAHRLLLMSTSQRIRDRENGLLPVVVIDKDEANRMASTIRHNRARGAHSIELMSNIVAELTQCGMSDAWILKHIGMDYDELNRLKQVTGLAALWIDNEFSETQYGD